MSADAPDPKAFRAAMGAFAGNISIITAEAEGEASGLVCTSVVSPSSDPPLLLAVLNAASSTWGLIERSGAFGWSSVGAAQEAVAKRFSGFGGVEGEARYDGAEWFRLKTGARLLEGAAACFDCVLHEAIRREGYIIVTGRVVAQRVTDGQGGMIWWQGGFRPLPG